MFAAVLGDLKEDVARTNGLYLHAALEELRVLWDFHEHDYRKHPKYNQQVVLHLFDTSLPRDIWEKATNGLGRNGLRFVRIDNTLSDLRASLGDHKSSIDRLETAVGSIRTHLQLPAQTMRNRHLRTSCCFETALWRKVGRTLSQVARGWLGSSSSSSSR